MFEDDIFPSKTILDNGGDWYFQYNFDLNAWFVIPVPRHRKGFGFWIAKPYDARRWGVLVDRHQLRIFLGGRVLIFGKRDMDFLLEDGYAS